MNDIIQFSFPIEYENIRIDKAVFDYLNGQHSRSCIQNWIQQGVLLCNGAICNKKQTVKEGDSILIEIPAPELLDVVPQDIPLDILYEDNDLLVINKPKGMVVHPACGNPDKTLVNALLFHCKNSLSGINGVLRPGIVHRIDKDTSGLLVVAKNDNSHVFLANQIKEHTMTREYRAIVHGKFKTP